MQYTNTGMSCLQRTACLLQNNKHTRSTPQKFLCISHVPCAATSAMYMQLAHDQQYRKAHPHYCITVEPRQIHNKKKRIATLTIRAFITTKSSTKHRPTGKQIQHAHTRTKGESERSNNQGQMPCASISDTHIHSHAPMVHTACVRATSSTESMHTRDKFYLFLSNENEPKLTLCEG